MATIGELKMMLDLYGVAVRAGALTPQIEDEIYFRKLIDLPEMTEPVRKDWAASDGVRKPLTIKEKGEGPQPMPITQEGEE
jgi:hypothetical protein